MANQWVFSENRSLEFLKTHFSHQVPSVTVEVLQFLLQNTGRQAKVDEF